MKAMNFGKYAVLDPVKHVFEKEPDWYWLIKPATAKGELAVSRILAQERVKVDLDGIRTNMQVTTLEVAMREIAVTFGGTNIPTSETDPTPIIKDDATVSEIEAVLQEMPRDLLLEIWKAVGDAVPGFGPIKPRATNKSEKTKNE